MLGQAPPSRPTLPWGLFSSPRKGLGVAVDYRDRIIELRRVPASELQANPKNWRLHPDNQRAAMEGVLSEVGYAGAALARELPDGSLQLIDGHLRKETAGDTPVPVLVLDVDENEADKILATHDPIAEMAQTHFGMLSDLKAGFAFEDERADKLLKTILGVNAKREKLKGMRHIKHAWEILITCDSADHQKELYEELNARGLKLKLTCMELD